MLFNFFSAECNLITSPLQTAHSWSDERYDLSLYTSLFSTIATSSCQPGQATMCKSTTYTFACGHLRQFWEYCSKARQEYVPIRKKFWEYCSKARQEYVPIRKKQPRIELPLRLKDVDTNSPSRPRNISSHRSTPSPSQGAVLDTLRISLPHSPRATTPEPEESVWPATSGGQSSPSNSPPPVSGDKLVTTSTQHSCCRFPPRAGHASTRRCRRSMTNFRVVMHACLMSKREEFAEDLVSPCPRANCEYERVGRRWRCCRCGAAPNALAHCSARNRGLCCGHGVCGRCEACRECSLRHFHLLFY